MQGVKAIWLKFGGIDSAQTGEHFWVDLGEGGGRKDWRRAGVLMKFSVSCNELVVGDGATLLGEHVVERKREGVGRTKGS